MKILLTTFTVMCFLLGNVQNMSAGFFFSVGTSYYVGGCRGYYTPRHVYHHSGYIISHPRFYVVDHYPRVIRACHPRFVAHAPVYVVSDFHPRHRLYSVPTRSFRDPLPYCPNSEGGVDTRSARKFIYR